LPPPNNNSLDKHWEGVCPLSQESKTELTWWNEEALRQNGLPIREVEMNATLPKMTIFTDASDLGWGIKSETLETSGHWTPEERSESINVRELKTILFALQLHAKSAQSSHSSPTASQR
jgi:hypothetical protein